MKSNFSYLDQFLDEEIDFRKYIEFISKKNNIDYTFSNKQPIKTTIKNLFYQTDIINDYKKNVLFFKKYKVEYNEKIDFIAYKMYDDSSLWWVIAIFNNIKNPYTDWVMNDEQITYTANLLYEYENKFPLSTYYKLLENQNEKYRILNILKSEYLGDLLYEFLQRIINKQNEL